jgi:hypothetical protein
LLELREKPVARFVDRLSSAELREVANILLNVAEADETKIAWDAVNACTADFNFF